MKKLPVLLTIVIGLALGSCSKKAPDFVNNIPDDAFLVVSVHPMNMVEKGQINTLENIKSEIKNEFVKTLMDDPAKSGVMLDEYSYMFIYFKNDQPMIGVVAGLKNKGDFEDALKKLNQEELEFTGHDNTTMYIKGDDMMAWTGDKVLFLNSPELEMSADDWHEEVTLLFNQPKEESITSMVDFKDFMGKMKDLNVWVSSDELRTVMEKSGVMRDMEIQLPIEFYNNYSQMYCEFTNEGVFINSETHLSEEVEKNAEMIMTKPRLNDALLVNTPGGNLLMAMAVSLKLDEFREFMEKVAPPEADQMGSQLEEMTGIPPSDLWDALTGDIVIAINGTEDGGMIPVEAFIGIGVKDEMLQEKLMGTVEGMVDVQQDGDFFMINANGLEIYSGILDGIWVITNSKGYKAAVTDGGLDKTLKDTKFSDFSNGGMGMYLNLDMSTYPAALQQMASQSEDMKESLEMLSGAFSFLGMQASNSESEMVLKAASSKENSLHTLLKMADEAAMK